MCDINAGGRNELLCSHHGSNQPQFQLTIMRLETVDDCYNLKASLLTFRTPRNTEKVTSLAVDWSTISATQNVFGTKCKWTIISIGLLW